MKNLDCRMDDVERLCREILMPEKKELPPELLEKWAAAYKQDESVSLLDCFNKLIEIDEEFKRLYTEWGKNNG